MGSSSESSPFGPVKNPWHRSAFPAAVPAERRRRSQRAGPRRTGTDTGGSIRQPAAITGIWASSPRTARLALRARRVRVQPRPGGPSRARAGPRAVLNASRATMHTTRHRSKVRSKIIRVTLAAERGPNLWPAPGRRSRRVLRRGVDPDVEAGVGEAMAEFAASARPPSTSRCRTTRRRPPGTTSSLPQKRPGTSRASTASATACAPPAPPTSSTCTGRPATRASAPK